MKHVPLVLLPALAFALFWSLQRSYAYIFSGWDEAAHAADFAGVALPSYYNTTAVANGFRDTAIHFLVTEHGLETKLHVGVGAIAAVAFSAALIFNVHARWLHRIVAPVAVLASFGLMASIIFSMAIRAEGMAPVGSAALYSNVLAVVTLAASLAVGLAAKSGPSPNYVLHRRAMIVAAGALFMCAGLLNPAQRFALAVAAHVPGLVPASYDTWPAFRDGPWNVALWAGAALSFGVAGLYAAGVVGEGGVAAGKATKAAAAAHAKTT